ncbi:hypothetical protein B0A48_14620 [Cryoendolithus antarcticus]|uniref:Protein kinase domain-containing protein n=1 Tax=Cryoendolithus antarcticus TaxID=1507870 RepID=A0A1V8SLM8_9PEZI|nr:hypothetical protein B0A48_14620 [Cryoendolithus antarcticus]
MAGSYSVQGGCAEQDKTWVMVMRGYTQFNITVHHDKITNTPFGTSFLPLLDKREDGRLVDHMEPLYFICEYCMPLIEKLAPVNSLRGCSLEGLVCSPTYELEIVGTGSDQAVSIIGSETCTFTPAFSIFPLRLHEQLASYALVPHIHAREVAVHVDEQAHSGTVQGTVRLEDGQLKFLKLRMHAREQDFDRELRILLDIRRKELASAGCRVSRLHAIVVSGNAREEYIVGILLDLITPSHFGIDFLSPQIWQQTAFQAKWEREVRATVDVLHANGIVWGDVNAGNVIIDEALNAWVIDFGGYNNPVFVDDDKVETMEADWQGIGRLFGEWLPARARGEPQ